MLKRKTFLKKHKRLQDLSSNHIRLRRLKHRRKKLFARHALRFVVRDVD